jgi:hypothetical protein
LIVILVPQERIVINFQQPGSEVFIHKEVESQKLVTIPSIFGVQVLFCRQHTINHDVSHLWKNVLLDVYVHALVLLIKEFLELVK